MTFVLKNEGATYQKCIHIILEPQIGRNIEPYIDDVVVKSKKRVDLFDDLKETFDNLYKYKMMINPKNMCLVYHQENCSATWYRPGEST
jgi:ATP-dependent phosphoenolpyruvate carboxykinase